MWSAAKAIRHIQYIVGPAVARFPCDRVRAGYTLKRFNLIHRQTAVHTHIHGQFRVKS